MSCEKFQNMFSEFIDNQLSPQDERILTEHLKSCDNCQKQLEEFKYFTDVLHSIGEVEVPDHFHESVMKKVNNQNNNRVLMFFRKRSTISAMAAAVVLIFGLKLVVDSPIIHKTPVEIQNRTSSSEKYVEDNAAENNANNTKENSDQNSTIVAPEESLKPTSKTPKTVKKSVLKQKPSQSKAPETGDSASKFPQETEQKQIAEQPSIASDNIKPAAADATEVMPFANENQEPDLSSLSRMGISSGSSLAQFTKHTITIPANDEEFSVGETTFEEYEKAVLKYPSAKSETEVLSEDFTENIYVIIKK